MKIKQIQRFIIIFLIVFSSISNAYAASSSASANIQINYDTKTFKQIEVAYYDCWRYSDGETWQDAEPGDNVDFTFTVESDSPDVTGIKSVQFFTDDEDLYNSTSRQTWQTYKEYIKTFYPYAVNNCSPQGEYIGNAKAKIKVNTTLNDWEGHIDDDEGLGGFKITKIWQHKKVTGRRFYVPVVVEWEMKIPAEVILETIILSSNGVEFDRQQSEPIPIPSTYKTYYSDFKLPEGAVLTNKGYRYTDGYNTAPYGTYSTDDFEPFSGEVIGIEYEFRTDGFTQKPIMKGE